MTPDHEDARDSLLSFSLRDPFARRRVSRGETGSHHPHACRKICCRGSEAPIRRASGAHASGAPEFGDSVTQAKRPELRSQLCAPHACPPSSEGKAPGPRAASLPPHAACVVGDLAGQSRVPQRLEGLMLDQQHDDISALDGAMGAFELDVGVPGEQRAEPGRHTDRRPGSPCREAPWRSAPPLRWLGFRECRRHWL